MGTPRTEKELTKQGGRIGFDGYAKKGPFDVKGPNGGRMYVDRPSGKLKEEKKKK